MLQNIIRSEPKKTIQSKIKKNVDKFKNIRINSQILKDNAQNKQTYEVLKENIIENNSVIGKGQENESNINNKLLANSKINESEDESNENKFHTGRWTEEEHQKFIDGILKYGNEWKKVQQIIKTRSSTQARSHAQKFFLKFKKNIQSNNVDFNDKEKIIEILTNNINANILTDIEKEKLLNVIFSNIKHEEYNNENSIDKICLEEENLGYKKEKENNNDSLSKIKSNDTLLSYNSEQKKLGLKRKYSKNLDMKDLDKIFNIKKDLSHRASMDFSISKMSNIDENRKNSCDNLKNSKNQKNKNFDNNNNNSNNANNNNQSNFDNSDDKKYKNNYIIHNYINVTNNYMNNNYVYNIHNPDTFNNIINNSTNYIQDSFNYNNDQSQNYYVNSQNYNKNIYNSNPYLDKNISNINGISKFNNFNDYDNINNNDPFKLEFGFYPDKNNNNENEHQYSINGEEEFIKTNNNNEDNSSII